MILKDSARPCFIKQHYRPARLRVRPKTDGFFWSETGLVIRPTVSDGRGGLELLKVKNKNNYTYIVTSA